jgi:hypothetical protein
MTRRVARSAQDHVQIDLVYCCECGSANLEVFHTSITLGPHLCPICAGSKVECSAGESMTRSPRRGRVQACGGARWKMNFSPSEERDRQNKEIISE